MIMAGISRMPWGRISDMNMYGSFLEIAIFKIFPKFNEFRIKFVKLMEPKVTAPKIAIVNHTFKFATSRKQNGFATVLI